MGYRSDVYLKTTKEGYKALEQEIKKNKLGYKLWEEPEHIYLNDAENTITVEWNYLKWYPEYEDVHTIEDAIGTMCDKYPIHFIRIGEDIEDIEDNYYYPDCYSGDFDCLELYRYVKPIGTKIEREELFNE